MIETSHIPKKWDINFISCCNIHPCNMFWIQFFDSRIVLFRPSKTIPAIWLIHHKPSSQCGMRAKTLDYLFNERDTFLFMIKELYNKFQIRLVGPVQKLLHTFIAPVFRNHGDNGIVAQALDFIEHIYCELIRMRFTVQRHHQLFRLEDWLCRKTVGWIITAGSHDMAVLLQNDTACRKLFRRGQ